jgi:hypothetical protein
MDEKSRNTSLISFCHSIQKNINWQIWNRLISFELRVEVSI